MKRENGITLIALVVTIIVFLILAAVSIAILTGENGILAQANNSSEITEIEQEKEYIKLAWSAAKIESTNSQKEMNSQILQEEMNTVVGSGNSTVIKCWDSKFLVTYIETKRSYKIGENSLIEEIERTNKVEDNNPGRLEISDTEEKTYIINSIEDLIQLSYDVNGISVNKDGTLSTKTSNSYSGYNIKLGKTLDFESVDSYVDYQTKDYGDVNSDGKIDTLMEEMLTGEGFLPIGSYNTKALNANFDGQNYEIKNVYENRSGNVGLFGFTLNNNLKDLGVRGTFISHSSFAAGIISVALGSKIDHCYFEGTVLTDYQGGTNVGGIVGGTGVGDKIFNCYCKGKISGYNKVGGIVGEDYNAVIKIINCYNLAKISGNECIGGIIGRNIKEIYNCYNAGEVSAAKSTFGGIVGTKGTSTRFENCYYLNIISKGIGNSSSDTAIEKSIDEMKSQEFVDKLNSNVDKYMEEDEENLNLLKWKQGEDGYPTFE